MRKAVLAVILALGFTSLMAQNYKANQSESEVIISGTSNVHDWEAPAEGFSGTATIKVTDGKIESIENMKLNFLVDKINSGKGGMDKKIDDALNKKKHPNIVFNLSEVSAIEGDTVRATGDLTISGVTKAVQLKVGYVVNADGSITFKGTQPIKMTDYKVDPPTAMLGAIKAGDEVVVNFDTRFVQ